MSGRPGDSHAGGVGRGVSGTKDGIRTAVGFRSLVIASPTEEQSLEAVMERGLEALKKQTLITIFSKKGISGRLVPLAADRQRDVGFNPARRAVLMPVAAFVPSGYFSLKRNLARGVSHNERHGTSARLDYFLF